MTIRTVTISDITAVDFDPDKERPYLYLSEKYVWVRNKSPAEIYVSANALPVPESFGTGEVPAGACVMFEMPETNILYFSGNGKAEVRTSSNSAVPFAGGGSSGGGGSGIDYSLMTNKPMLNGTELDGDKTGSDYGLVDEDDYLTDQQINELIGLIDGFNSSIGDATVEHRTRDSGGSVQTANNRVLFAPRNSSASGIDYSADVVNKPRINGVELDGNKSGSDYFVLDEESNLTSEQLDELFKLIG